MMGAWYLFLYVMAMSTLLQQVTGNTELRALMELKSALDPTNKVLKSWTSGGDPCSGFFEGVACNEHRKVANISLQGKGLSGTLSPSIAELKCLSGLYLHYNSLSGGIPKEISNLTELSDLYLNVNSLSGSIPSEIGSIPNLQFLDLCCNQLTGDIPENVGSLKKLTVLALQYNKLSGQIPASLGNLGLLRRLDLGFNQLSGTIPPSVANLPQLQAFDVRNNSFYGNVPSALKSLNRGFQFENNNGLCGFGFTSLRECGPYDNVNTEQVNISSPFTNNTAPKVVPESAVPHTPCNQSRCSKPSKLRLVAIITAVITVTVTLTAAGILIFIRYRRQKQKIGAAADSSDGRESTDQAKELYRTGAGASPLLSLEYSNGWNRFSNEVGFTEENLNNFRFNIEEIESATQCFSPTNFMGKSSFSSVYKGILRDGSVVAIRSINLTSCKSDESEFSEGLNLLTSLRHENLVRLRGFCFSRGRGECYLIYHFASKGNLASYLDVEDRSHPILDWSTRVSIINGIAKGIGYLHSSEANKPTIIHRNISVEKILLDHQFKPLIADSGLSQLLADDFLFSTLKTSAAMGYLAPEYIMTGRFTEKSDVYAFGVMILQILSGKQVLSNSIRVGAKSCEYEEFVDSSLDWNFSKDEAANLAQIALACTHEIPEERPTTEVVIQHLNQRDAAT